MVLKRRAVDGPLAGANIIAEKTWHGRLVNKTTGFYKFNLLTEVWEWQILPQKETVGKHK